MDVAQVGVITRALVMEAAASSGSAKRRKVGGGELDFSSSLVQLKSRRQDNKNLVLAGNSTASNDQWSSPSSDHVPVSCCSSNGSTEEESVEIEKSPNNFDCRERREMTPLREGTGELDSTDRPLEANPHRQSTVQKMPSEAELEEFFAFAEKDLQKQFTDKYNYDIAKDEHLEGRYEWVRVKP